MFLKDVVARGVLAAVLVDLHVVRAAAELLEQLLGGDEGGGQGLVVRRGVGLRIHPDLDIVLQVSQEVLGHRGQGVGAARCEVEAGRELRGQQVGHHEEDQEDGDLDREVHPGQHPLAAAPDVVGAPAHRQRLDSTTRVVR